MGPADLLSGFTGFINLDAINGKLIFNAVGGRGPSTVKVNDHRTSTIQRSAISMKMAVPIFLVFLTGMIMVIQFFVPHEYSDFLFQYLWTKRLPRAIGSFITRAT